MSGCELSASGAGCADPPGGAVTLGAAGALLGPVWAAVGVLVGPFVAVIATAVWQLCAKTEPEICCGRAATGRRCPCYTAK